MSDTNQPTGMPLPDALAGNFQDAVRWFNQLWGAGADASSGARGAGGAIPSMMLPTLDVKELDKRIADLRSVEHWLNLNLSLLRTTIQGLEMQRSTLAAWQTFGANSAGTGSPTGPGATGNVERPAAGAAAETAAFQPALWWAALQQQFAQMAASAAAQAAPAAGAAPSPPEEGAPAAGGAAPGMSKPAGKAKTPGPARG
ncbi:conserved hypothetical protein [Burkholderiales bacterium]|nr:conserved hypothetical protein [Burkholderiales bacterium]